MKQMEAAGREGTRRGRSTVGRNKSLPFWSISKTLALSDLFTLKDQNPTSSQGGTYGRTLRAWVEADQVIILVSTMTAGNNRRVSDRNVCLYEPMFRSPRGMGEARARFIGQVKLSQKELGDKFSQ